MMTPEEQVIVQEKLREGAEILYKNTPSKELQTFETVELSLRNHLLPTVAQNMGAFFLTQQEERAQEEREQ